MEKTTKRKRHVWVCRDPLDAGGEYTISATKPKKERAHWNPDHWWWADNGASVCAKFLEACTGIKMEPGAKPVKMEITLGEWPS